MNKLIAFGDSFTWGTDLNDDWLTSEMPLVNGVKNPEDSDVEYTMDTFFDGWKDYSNETWTALLANELGMQYVCHASPGASNGTILRRILSNVNSLNRGDFVVVNWTWIDRWDMFDISNDEWVTLRPHMNKTDGVLVTPKDDGNDVQVRLDIDPNLHKFYYKYIQSELWDKLETLKNMALIINILEGMGIRFITTCVDKLSINTEFHAPQYILELQDMVSSKLTWFDSDGFYDWSMKNNFPVGETGHPLEEAHQTAFEYIKNNHDFTK